MKFWSAILALLVMVFATGVSSAATATSTPKPTILTAGQEHATADGAKVKNNSDSSGKIYITEYPASGNTPAHSTIEFKNGACGSVGNADGDNVITTNDDNVVTVDGNSTQVNMKGNDASVTINGHMNSVDCDHATNGNQVTLNGNSNDVDLNGSNNNATSNGSNNNIHN